MPAVSNTSPILNLAAVGQLSLLQSQFGSVFIPQAVADELQLDQNHPGNSDIRNAIKSGWIRIQ